MGKVRGPSVEFVLRIVGALILLFTGLQTGLYLDREYAGFSSVPFRVLLPLLGFMAGLILTPYVTTRPAQALRRWVAQLPAPKLFTGLLGLFFGLLISALLSLVLWLIPFPTLRAILALVATGLIVYTSMLLFLTRERDIWALFKGRYEAGLEQGPIYLVDTSALIEGRLLALARKGFPPGILMVPRFVLQELQSIADSDDPGKRRRGRRGLAILEELRQLRRPQLEISDIEVLDAEKVDEKLVRLARRLNAVLITTDYNLTQVARVQDAPVLNLHELAQALQIPLMPGDEITVEVVQPGKGADQGLAFLDDGTMVVVEQGREFIGRTIQAVVTKVLPTQGGRIVFVRPKRAVSR